LIPIVVEYDSVVEENPRRGYNPEEDHAIDRELLDEEEQDELNFKHKSLKKPNL
jgi:hypothetical protein